MTAGFATTAGLILAQLVTLLVSSASQASPAAPLELDPSGTEAAFQLATTWHAVEGHTRAVSGSLTSRSGDIFEDGQVSMEVDAASLETGNGMRDRKMRETCLETSKFPKITFVSTGPPVIRASKKDPDGGYREVTLEAPGDLTIHGVTRRVALPATARRDGTGWTFEGKFIVKLSDHSIPDPSILFNKVKDDVTVTFMAKLRQPGSPAK